MSLKPSNPNQQPENSILDEFNRQTYLGNSYVASTNNLTISSADTETPIMLLVNPATNSVPTNGFNNIALFNSLRKLSQATNVSTATTLFRFYGQPTVTSNGTALALNNLRPGWGKTSVMNAYKSPSVSSNGTFIAIFAVNYQEIDTSLLNILDPGYSLLVTAETDTASTQIICELSWDEI